jgi:hypothetical protein
MLAGFEPLPLKHYREAVGEYINQTTVGSDGVIPLKGLVQAPSIVYLHVGLFCKGSTVANDREECDHVLHTISLINDHTDGFHDELLTNAVIKVHEADSGCIDGRALQALRAIQASVPAADQKQLVATIGPGCSDDVEMVANRMSRDNVTV